jgi:uncharacterized Zn-binding protein involved in type VI secretion
MKMRILLLATTLILGVPGTVVAGSPAARLGDVTSHAGLITTGSPTVFVQGLPAALFGTFVPCPIPFHVGGNIVTGSATVLINGAPAVRSGSLIFEVGASSIVIGGATTVLIQ